MNGRWRAILLLDTDDGMVHVVAKARGQTAEDACGEALRVTDGVVLEQTSDAASMLNCAIQKKTPEA